MANLKPPKVPTGRTATTPGATRPIWPDPMRGTMGGRRLPAPKTMSADADLSMAGPARAPYRTPMEQLTEMGSNFRAAQLARNVPQVPSAPVVSTGGGGPPGAPPQVPLPPANPMGEQRRQLQQEFMKSEWYTSSKLRTSVRNPFSMFVQQKRMEASVKQAEDEAFYKENRLEIDQENRKRQWEVQDRAADIDREDAVYERERNDLEKDRQYEREQEADKRERDAKKLEADRKYAEDIAAGKADVAKDARTDSQNFQVEMVKLKASGQKPSIHNFPMKAEMDALNKKYIELASELAVADTETPDGKKAYDALAKQQDNVFYAHQAAVKQLEKWMERNTTAPYKGNPADAGDNDPQGLRG